MVNMLDALTLGGESMKEIEKFFGLSLEEIIKCELEVVKDIVSDKSLKEILADIVRELEKAENRRDISKAVIKAMVVGAYRLVMSGAEAYLRLLELIAITTDDLDSASKRLANIVRDGASMVQDDREVV